MDKPDILPEMLVTDLVMAWPSAISFLASRNLNCIICGEPVWGTLEELARDKHFNQDQIDEMIADLKAEIETYI